MTENQMFHDLWSRIPSASASQLLLPEAAAAKEGQITQFLLDFKSGREPQTTQWIRLASLVASHSFSCDIVVRALSPKEKVAAGATPLDKLGSAIARKTNAKYCPARLQRVNAGLDSLVMDADYSAQSGETYRFDKSFLPPTARVLVVGDIDTTPGTFEAITAAIHSALPRAEVKVFTLAWVGEHLKDEQIDGKYFTTSVSPLSVLKKEEPASHESAPKAKTGAPIEAPPTPVPDQKEEAPAESPAPEAKTDAPIEAPPTPVPDQKEEAPAESPAPVAEEVTLTPPPQPPDPEPVRARPKLHTGAPFKVRTRTGSAAVAILLTGAAIVLVTSAIMLFAKKPATLEAATFNALPVMEEPVVVAEKVTPPAPTSATSKVPTRPQGPVGVVTVPSAGLRAGHSLDAKSVRGTVRNNERVTILKRHYGDAGPGWVQIETKSGKVGWVWAAVVREVKSDRSSKQ